jgi:2-dehydro-3-deoxygluconokinase
MDVVTIGEAMVVFSPMRTGYLRHAHTFQKGIAGAESNVAIGLARLGHKVGWISRLGEDEFGTEILAILRGEGVDVSQVIRDDSSPTGIYFKEFLRPEEIRVYYYRQNSAASKLSVTDLDEAYIAKAKYLHLTGITPALSDACLQTVWEAIRVAKKNGVKIVFDPNLRRKLWKDENEAKRILLELSSYADIVLPGLSEGEFLFGKCDIETMAEKFLENGASLVVLKLGENGAYYSSNEDKGSVPAFEVKQVVDPVGAGDGFAAGFLSGLLEQNTIYDAVYKGCVVGAAVTMANGDVEGLPDKQSILSLLSQQEDVLR